MRKHLPAILTLVACVLTAFCLIRISNLESEMQSLRNEVGNISGDVNRQLANTYANIDALLEAQASLLAAADFEIGQLDANTLTVPVTVSIIPKTLQNHTVVALQLGPELISLTRHGITFTAEIPMALTDWIEQPQVVITTGDTQSVETLSWYLCPLAQIMPTSDIFISGTTYVNPEYKIEGPLEVNLYAGDMATMEQVTFVALLDGDVLERLAVPVTDISEQHWQGTLELDQGWDIPKGSTLELFVEASIYQLIWRFPVDIVTRQTDGIIAQADIWSNTPLELLTVDGKCIPLDRLLY